MSAKAIRLSGLALMGGGLLLAAAILLVSAEPTPNQVFSPLTSLCFLLAGLLLSLGLPGFYARQAEAAGWLGLAGFGLLQVGVALFVVLAAPPLTYPALSGPMPDSDLVPDLALGLALGLLLTGVATLRARAYPRWTSALLLAGMLLFVFDFFISETLPMPPALTQLSIAVLGAVLGLPIVGWGLALALASPALARPAPAAGPASA
jgi:hypothetical protein